jgi:TetR/AcrR family transcriptional repressor of nem operon
MQAAPKTASQNTGPGRPREFDVEAALDKAILVFRERGYHSASLGELGAAMELTTGSIYKAFKDKQTIFLAAFDRYTRLRDTELRRRLGAASSGFEKLRSVLHFYAEASYGSEGRRGCLVVGSATELATFEPEMAGRVSSALRRVEALLRDLIRLGQSDGSISSLTDVKASARALLCLLEGLRVIGKLGRSRAEMMSAADQALRLLA